MKMKIVTATATAPAAEALLIEAYSRVKYGSKDKHYSIDVREIPAPTQSASGEMTQEEEELRYGDVIDARSKINQVKEDEYNGEND